MKRGLIVVLALLALGVLSATAAPAARGFGFGGALGMAMFPDMTEVNTFLSENGMPPMGKMLIGPGGSGRGGVIGGGVFGGIGWAMFGTSETEALSAELISTGGGFDLGSAIGGDAGSVLTIGTVIGGGANVLGITGYLYPTVTPEGLVPEPTYREIVFAHGFVLPYVSMEAQLFPWMGFELRIGYLIPVYGATFGDTLGIPAPSLELSGPTVSFGLMFGGIGTGGGAEESATHVGRNTEITRATDGTLAIAEGESFELVNALGNIVISSYEGAGQTGSAVIEWQAVETAKAKEIDDVEIVVTSEDGVARLEGTGPGQIDFVLRIPSGVDLHVKNAAGELTVVGHQAQTIIVEVGIGEIHLQDVEALALIATAGLGSITLESIDAQHLIADAGLGEITLGLAPSTSATLTAKASLGSVDIDRFPLMVGGTRGWLGQSADVTLGSGDKLIELKVGLGTINVAVEL